MLDDMPTTPRLIYYGPFGQHTGYARAIHDNLMALRHRMGDKVSIAPLLPFNTEGLEDRYKLLLDRVLKPEQDPRATHAIVHVPPFHAHLIVDDIKAPVKILYTTWETDSYPRESAEKLNAAYDAMIVPCEQNHDVFKAAGFKKPIHVVPHCHDPVYWTPDESVPKYENFTFYWIGVWSERKNPIGLLKAYFAEFREKDPVQLIMCCANPQGAKDDIESLVLCMGMPDYPKLFIQKGVKTDDEIRTLHRRAHCYVTAARGEGFGLGAHEAALLGNPVIAPTFAGHLDALAHHEDGVGRGTYPGWIQVDYQLTPAIPQEHQAQRSFQIAGLTITPKSKRAPLGISAEQAWAEPDLMQIREAMRSVRRQTYYNPSWNAYYSYARVGELLYNIVQETR